MNNKKPLLIDADNSIVGTYHGHKDGGNPGFITISYIPLWSSDYNIRFKPIELEPILKEHLYSISNHFSIPKPGFESDMKIVFRGNPKNIFSQFTDANTEVIEQKNEEISNLKLQIHRLRNDAEKSASGAYGQAKLEQDIKRGNSSRLGVPELNDFE